MTLMRTQKAMVLSEGIYDQEAVWGMVMGQMTVVSPISEITWVGTSVFPISGIQDVCTRDHYSCKAYRAVHHSLSG